MSIVQHGDRHGWQARAACATEVSSTFYPPVRGESRRTKRNREGRAKAVCALCAVRTECLAHALANDERYGIWGGLTDSERRALADQDTSQAG